MRGRGIRGSVQYLPLAGCNDSRQPAALPSVHQQENNIVGINELLKLGHIPLSLGHGHLREIHWVAWHGDAHVVTFGALWGGRQKIRSSEGDLVNWGEIQHKSESKFNPCLSEWQLCSLHLSALKHRAGDSQAVFMQNSLRESWQAWQITTRTEWSCSWSQGLKTSPPNITPKPSSHSYIWWWSVIKSCVLDSLSSPSAHHLNRLQFVFLLLDPDSATDTCSITHSALCSQLLGTRAASDDFPVIPQPCGNLRQQKALLRLVTVELEEFAPVAQTFPSSSPFLGQGTLRANIEANQHLHNACTMQTMNSPLWKCVSTICQPSAAREGCIPHLSHRRTSLAKASLLGTAGKTKPQNVKAGWTKSEIPREEGWWNVLLHRAINYQHSSSIQVSQITRRVKIHKYPRG